MDALDVLKVCLRRWYIIIPTLAIAIGAGFGLAAQQRPTYTAFASYALVYQGTVTEIRDPRTANPLGGNDALLLGEALMADLMSGPSQTLLGGFDNSGVEPGEADEGTAYTVSRPDGSESYIVQTWGKNPEGARGSIDAVLATAPGRAVAIQDRVGAPKRSQYAVFVTLPTQITQLPPTSTVKLVIALSGVGMLTGAALSLIVDRLVRTSRARRTHRPALVVAWDDPNPTETDQERTRVAVPASADGGRQVADPAVPPVEAAGQEPMAVAATQSRAVVVPAVSAANPPANVETETETGTGTSGQTDVVGTDQTEPHAAVRAAALNRARARLEEYFAQPEIRDGTGQLSEHDLFWEQEAPLAPSIEPGPANGGMNGAQPGGRNGAAPVPRNVAMPVVTDAAPPVSTNAAPPATTNGSTARTGEEPVPSGNQSPPAEEGPDGLGTADVNAQVDERRHRQPTH